MAVVLTCLQPLRQGIWGSKKGRQVLGQLEISLD